MLFWFWCVFWIMSFYFTFLGSKCWFCSQHDVGFKVPKDITIFIVAYVENEDKFELFVSKESEHDQGDWVQLCRCGWDHDQIIHSGGLNRWRIDLCRCRTYVVRLGVSTMRKWKRGKEVLGLGKGGIKTWCVVSH